MWQLGDYFTLIYNLERHNLYHQLRLIKIRINYFEETGFFLLKAGRKKKASDYIKTLSQRRFRKESVVHENIHFR